MSSTHLRISEMHTIHFLCVYIGLFFKCICIQNLELCNGLLNLHEMERETDLNFHVSQWKCDIFPPNNEMKMNFHKSFEKWSILTPDIGGKKKSNLLRITVRGSHVHKPMVKFLGWGGGGGPEFFCFVCKFLKNIDGFRQNNSQSF